MNTTIQTLQELFGNPTMEALGNFANARGVQLYLVGGSVRDLLLKRQTTDIDFALASGCNSVCQGVCCQHQRDLHRA